MNWFTILAFKNQCVQLKRALSLSYGKNAGWPVGLEDSWQHREHTAPSLCTSAEPLILHGFRLSPPVGVCIQNTPFITWKSVFSHGPSIVTDKICGGERLMCNRGHFLPSFPISVATQKIRWTWPHGVVMYMYIPKKERILPVGVTEGTSVLLEITTEFLEPSLFPRLCF